MAEKDVIYTQNRELSWLRFNERVLKEALEKDVPAFEKLKFISIFTSNLDEFFMIRVGSLYDQTFLPKPQKDNKTGMTAEEQLDAIFKSSAALYKKRDRIYKDVTAELAGCGIRHMKMSELGDKDRKYIEEYFTSYIQPVLSPQIVSTHHPFPHLVNKGLYTAVLLQINDTEAFGIIPVPQSIGRVIRLPGDGMKYVLTENIVTEYAGRIFDNCSVTARSTVSITRNADINVSSLADEDEDFRHHMKKLLKKRSRLAPVRMEYYREIDQRLEAYLAEKLGLRKKQIFSSKAPLEMSYVFGLLDMLPKNMVPSVTYESFEPQRPAWMVKGESMIHRVMREDILLSYPYQQMAPFLQLLKEAADDPRVISIKITIYRLAGKASLIDYLRTAAENGKEVTVIMELRARFDEANNINWAESLEEAGCTVIYGLPDYKVHSKVCLITLMDRDGIKRITQVGNYNEKTAKLYTDLSLITSDEAIGSDAAEYFKNMSIANINGRYNDLLVAPGNMKTKLLALMDGEREKALRGEKASITVKLNSLTDRETIDMLKEASMAGVKVRMIIRGICCLLPGVDGYTDNVQVTGVVGRFLEHSRVYCFGEGEDMLMYISSADFMTRNLNRRVEVACPIKDRAVKAQIWEILQLMLSDNVKARTMDCRGIYRKKERDGQAVDCQKELMKRAVRQVVSPVSSAAAVTPISQASQTSIIPPTTPNSKGDFGGEKGSRKKAFAGSANILRRLFRK